MSRVVGIFWWYNVHVVLVGPRHFCCHENWCERLEMADFSPLVVANGDILLCHNLQSAVCVQNKNKELFFLRNGDLITIVNICTKNRYLTEILWNGGIFEIPNEKLIKYYFDHVSSPI